MLETETFAGARESGRELELSFGMVHEVQQRAYICAICRRLADPASLSVSIEQSDMVAASVTNVEDLDPIRVTAEADVWFHLYFKRPGAPIFSTLSIRVLSRLFVGRKGEPDPTSLSFLQRPGKDVNWGAVNSWFYECRDNCINWKLSPTITTASTPWPASDRCSKGMCHARPFTPSCRCAALSYVWGSPAKVSLRATGHNIGDLEKEGWLFNASLPATIREAMTEKHDQINALSAVYSNSDVTLAALGGTGIDCGLPGVSDRKHSTRLAFSTQGITMIQKHSSYSEIVETSVWNTRGWTYQEAVLAPKLLLFSDSGVFYECGYCSGIRGEDDTMRDGYTDERMFDLSFSNSTDISVVAKRYAELLDSYTKRTLTYDLDILKAFSGVLHSQYRNYHYRGLPFSIFDIAIRWTTQDGKYTPRLAQETANSERQTWNGRSGDAALAFVGAWKKGCLSGELPASLKVNTTWTQEGDCIAQGWQSLEHLIYDAHGLERDTERIPNPNFRFPLELVHKASYPSRILVSTQSLSLQVVAPQGAYEYIMLQTNDGTPIACMDPESLE
ncbi:hypothetical protein BBP40_001636 [Aspergillus hancockii]|nr:hypothetical protein BBP40_001636 [Aspergillus hancockii]